MQYNTVEWKEYDVNDQNPAEYVIDHKLIQQNIRQHNTMHGKT